MDEQTKQKIIRLYLEQIDIDEAKKHQCIIAGTGDSITKLLSTIAKSDYGYIHPVWVIPLYLSRN